MKPKTQPRREQIRLTLFLEPEDRRTLGILKEAHGKSMCVVALDLLRPAMAHAMREVVRKLTAK
jgi:hypothetical protein